jgi:hypothetical protein
MKDAHAESEDAFTPTVVARRRAVVWDCMDAKPVDIGGETWGRFTLGVEEMRHAVGRPVLKDRVFPVLQMTASALGDGDEQREKEEFIVVSVTVADFDQAPEAELARGGDVVVATYASVERVRKVSGSGGIEWIMATASDARGTLPMWVQIKAVPGQIAKDVALFLGWIAGERKKVKVTAGEKGTDGGGGGNAVAASRREDAVENQEQEAPREGVDGDNPTGVGETLEGEGNETQRKEVI